MFDPTQYGATPASPTTFDPTQYGATLTTPTSPPQTLSSKIWDTVTQNYKSGKINAADVALQAVGEAARQANEFFQSPYNPISWPVKAVTGAADLLGKGITAVEKPVVTGLGNATRNLIGGENIDKAVQPIKNAALDVANSPLGQAVQETATKLSQDPKFTGDLQAVMNIAGTAGNVVLAGQEAEAMQAVGDVARHIIQTKLVPKYVEDTAQAYRDVAGNTIKANRTLNQSIAKGKDPAQYLAERNIVPDVVKGKMQTTAAQAQVDAYAQPLNDAMDQALQELKPSIPETDLNAFRKSALSKVNSLDLTETGKQAIRNNINQEVDLLVNRYGETAPIDAIQGIKKANWAQVRFDALNPYQGDANYLIGKTAQQTIESAAGNNVAIHELNNAIGDAIDAKKFLSSLDGRAIKGGWASRLAARVTGAVIGHSLPIPGGAIAGTVGADVIMNVLQSNSFSNPVKAAILKNLQASDPEAFKQAMEFIATSRMESALRPKLGTGAPLGTPENPIVTPPPTTYEPQAPQTNYPKATGGIPETMNTENQLFQEARKYKSAEEFVKAKAVALRQGEIDKNGAYFSTPGQSTYYDVANKSAKLYDISNAKIAESGTPEMRSVLEEAARLKNSPKELERIKSALIPDAGTDNFVDYKLFDEVPSIKKAYEKLGYDGVKVWENDDIANPSSVFISNINKIKTKSQLTDIWEKANKK